MVEESDLGTTARMTRTAVNTDVHAGRILDPGATDPVKPKRPSINCSRRPKPSIDNACSYVENALRRIDEKPRQTSNPLEANLKIGFRAREQVRYTSQIS